MIFASIAWVPAGSQMTRGVNHGATQTVTKVYQEDQTRQQKSSDVFRLLS
jgi:hypothetical protein